ncbi:MAG: S41 family peptidase [Flavobacteriales bacterium]
MRNRAAIPALLAVAIVVGLLLGLGLGGRRFGANNANWQKIDQILQYVENDYVDTISRAQLEEEVIAYLLQRLDPHSYYISEEDVAAMNEPLNGGFEGVGIQFNLDHDTIYVVKTVKGGPSERAGIQAGDRILVVNGDSLAGKNLSSADVMSLLKGPSGTSVEIALLRNSNWLTYSITRGEIPLRSIDAAYMLNDSTIYVKLARFSKTTIDEFEQEVYPLNTPAAKHFIFDLRGNGGGYLDAASDLADEFLEDGLLITYTEGKSRPRADYFSTNSGRFEDIALYVVIDGRSASASEVFAGAMQDHHRARIYGQRSFGKGLVQEQNEWTDGSATRLTVARYYTPNGRSIQRPYESFETDLDYYSIAPDSLQAGGITPNVIVNRDTTGITWFYAELVHRGLINEFAYDYRDVQLEILRSMPFGAFADYLNDEVIIAALREYLEIKGVEINEHELQRSKSTIAERIRASIARSLYDEESYYRIINPHDAAVKRILSDIKKPKFKTPA